MRDVYVGRTLYIGTAEDVLLVRDAANVFALKNGTTAQEARIYGTTTASKYLSLLHNGTNAILSPSTGAGTLRLNATPSQSTKYFEFKDFGDNSSPTIFYLGAAASDKVTMSAPAAVLVGFRVADTQVLYSGTAWRADSDNTDDLGTTALGWRDL